MSKYDIIIIGSGLGGLECGAILSKEGYHVCVLEKNELFGGCFQTYQRSGTGWIPAFTISAVWMKDKS